MSRVFLSHSGRDSRQAVAVKKWLVEQEPGLVDEIYLDLNPHNEIRPRLSINELSEQLANVWRASPSWMNCSRNCSH